MGRTLAIPIYKALLCFVMHTPFYAAVLTAFPGCYIIYIIYMPTTHLISSLGIFAEGVINYYRDPLCFPLHSTAHASSSSTWRLPQMKKKLISSLRSRRLPHSSWMISLATMSSRIFFSLGPQLRLRHSVTCCVVVCSSLVCRRMAVVLCRRRSKTFLKRPKYVCGPCSRVCVCVCVFVWCVLPLPYQFLNNRLDAELG